MSIFFQINDLPKPVFMEKTPKELGIGSWGNICTISKDTPLIEAMQTFLSKRVSALPLLDSEGQVNHLYFLPYNNVYSLFNSGCGHLREIRCHQSCRGQNL